MNTLLRIKACHGTGVPIKGDDVDTDQIVPARFLKEISFEKMGDYLFYDLRYEKDNSLKQHPLNNQAYKGASIMVVGENFGCGSSREHAPQAIKRYGISAIIGISFAEIFAGNCKEIGVPVVTASRQAIESLQMVIEESPHFQIRVDLDQKCVFYGDFRVDIQLPEERRTAFLEGTWNVLSLLKEQAETTQALSDSLDY